MVSSAALCSTQDVTDRPTVHDKSMTTCIHAEGYYFHYYIRRKVCLYYQCAIFTPFYL